MRGTPREENDHGFAAEERTVGEGVRRGESKKGMHMGIAVSLGEQLSQTQLHRFFSVVDFCSRFFRRVIAERSSSVVHYVCTTASTQCPENRACRVCLVRRDN